MAPRKPRADRKASKAKAPRGSFTKIPGDTPVEDVVNQVTRKPRTKTAAKPKKPRKPVEAEAPEPQENARTDRNEKGQFLPGYAGGPGPDTLYTQELGDQICELIAQGLTVNTIARMDGMPSGVTIRRWALKDGHPFATQYARAREIGYHKMADDLMEIADDGRNDWMERNGKDDAGWIANGEHQARSRLRLDTRKWMLSKVLPKIYGDKVALTNADGGAFEVRFVA